MEEKRSNQVNASRTWHDHDYIRGMGAAITQYKGGDHNVLSQIVENARGYIALLTQHID